MLRDTLVTLGLTFGLAMLVTSYLCIAYGLLWRPPRWRAAVALLVPFLAPYWAFRERMRVRGVVFVLGAVVYLISLWDSFRGA